MNSAVEFDDKGWQAEPRKVARLQDCQFPKSTGVEIGDTRKQATITMKKKGLHANMQTNATASEAWTLPAQHAHVDRRQRRRGQGEAHGHAQGDRKSVV